MAPLDYRPSSFTLLETLEHMRELLRKRGFLMEEGEWVNPIPNVWSVRLQDKLCSRLVSNGKGVSKEAALVSAYGEMLERLSCNYFFNGLYLSAHACSEPFVYYPQEKWFPFEDDEWPRGLLDGPTLAHYNLSQDLVPEQLIDAGSGDRSRGICALPFIRQRNHQTVWFPVNIISNLYVGNGMAVGAGKYEARVQALSEIFERHIKTTIITDGISLPLVPDEVLARYPHVQEMVTTLESNGLIVEVRDASLNGKFPLINVTVMNPVSGGCFACFGSHPRFGMAMERAFTEMLQGRELQQLIDLPEPTFDLTKVAEQANLDAHFSKFTGRVCWDLFSESNDYHFVDWDVTGTPEEQFNHLCHLIHIVDMDIYIADYAFMGMAACRIIVPGMSEVHPVSRLGTSNDNRARHLRQRLLALPLLDVPALRELLDELEDMDLPPHQDLGGLLGLLTDDDSVWKGLTVCEIRLLINLALGEREQVLGDLKDVVACTVLPQSRRPRYRCLLVLLQLDLDLHRDLLDYLRVLQRMYGEVLVEQCIAMLEGRAGFPGFIVAGDDLDGFASHQMLLEARDKVQKAKAAHYFALR